MCVLAARKNHFERSQNEKVAALLAMRREMVKIMRALEMVASERAHLTMLRTRLESSPPARDDATRKVRVAQHRLQVEAFKKAVREYHSIASELLGKAGGPFLTWDYLNVEMGDKPAGMTGDLLWEVTFTV